MNKLLDFFDGLTTSQKAIFQLVHQECITFHSLQLKMRYGLPFYDGKKWICYFNPQKSGMVELCFLNGQALSPRPGVIEAKGRKMVAGVTLKTVEDYLDKDVASILEEAVLFDQEHFTS
jgi:hypothetical protein